ncbi:regulator of telomere elongation helicase 1 homolog [Wyeomyia smithii]|uniref:regulator of telomere elongation helicase 1 homolog n=1 Tax=Wyeomyia smithii TaxID=174621 RepID=UPI002467C309|nr:regulator of telomere elongation helicase 1 homolog [Wyeomyia smithii]
MPDYTINGIPVNFPFEPYQIQKDYMAKVIECLQTSTNGVLESPTGTGKTLSLLCSSLAWLFYKKKHMQADMRTNIAELKEFELVTKYKLTGSASRATTDKADLVKNVNDGTGVLTELKIIYASRTHSQLTQAMQEMKNSNYSFMRAIILGSRDQLCIHPDISKEQDNSSKTNLCKAKIQSRSCSFYNRVENCKDRPDVVGCPILDIEDLIKTGTKAKACPFYLSKELTDKADIIFMPYNYLLDPKARKANNLQLSNTIIILDEAHNVEKMCEESSSTQIKSSDIALCIDDITSIMSVMDKSVAIAEDDEGKKDFTIDDLALLKEMMLALEKAVDNVPMMFSQNEVTLPGTYIFDVLNKANINDGNFHIIAQLIDNIIQYISTISGKNNFVRRGGGLQTLAEALSIIFAGTGAEYRESVSKCYRVHVDYEETKKVRGNVHQADGWTATKQQVQSVNGNAKILNFWCFNPGFSMRQLLGHHVRSIILTSGTLSPLKPLISELDIPVAVRLENPHIIDGSQVCVKIVTRGPDRVNLNSSYVNRDNPAYIQSLGRTILSFCPIINGGLLVFFPSYPVLNKCQGSWQESGVWAQITRTKPIFVEPRGKDQFLNTMAEYYQRINEPGSRGAVFMAVCRGKVSEGLDFADMNGRAVIITGLPFPPLKDARIILKKKYLEEVRNPQNEIITGDEWYSLEASRAVNQAIGRVIRHKNDYGVILLCDDRFRNPRLKAQLSSWIQPHLNSRQYDTFGPIIGELSKFFRNAEKNIPLTKLTRTLTPASSEPSATSVNSNCSNLTMNPGTKKILEDIKINFNTIDMSNDSSAFKILDYQNDHSSPPRDKPIDFFSRLNTHAKSIDFNEMITNVKPSSSQHNEVAINKRVRSPLIKSYEPMSVNEIVKKKRKLVLVPEAKISPLDSPDDELISQSVREQSEDDRTRVASTDRVELLKEIKTSISSAKYKLFLTCVTNYKSDKRFDVFIDGMLEAFDRPELYYLLRTMRRFVNKEHEDQFDIKIAEVCG